MKLSDIITTGTYPQILGVGYGFTEGPAADAAGNVYFSDGQNDTIHFYEVGRPVVPFVTDSTDAVGMIMSPGGELYVCEGAAGRVVAFDVTTREKRILCDGIDGTRFNEPNDLAVDLAGGFYFSDPNYAHRGQPTVMKEDSYYCTADGKVTRVSTICNKPNGVVLSADGQTLYIADARGDCVYRYDVLGPGKLAGERKWVQGLGGNPDGMTLDEHDNLYVCMNKKGVAVFDRTGEKIGHLDVTASNVCFAGPEFDTLHFTAADEFVAIKTTVTGVKPRCM